MRKPLRASRGAAIVAVGILLLVVLSLRLSRSRQASPAVGSADFPSFFYEGDEARRRILDHASDGRGDANPVAVPESASEFRLFEDRSFGKLAIYWSLRCRTEADCWQTIAAFGGPSRDQFRSAIETDNSIVLQNPTKGLPIQNVQPIRRGAVFQTPDTLARPDTCDLYTIDFDSGVIFCFRRKAP